MMNIDFAKLSGSGNDFLCIDNRDGRFEPILADPQRIAHFARTLCRRGLGVGADGIIFACRPEIEEVADIGARFFEPDGSEAELCGNGTGCFVHWITDAGWVPGGRQIRILTPAGIVLGRNSIPPYAQVCIPDPEDVRTNLELTVDGQKWICDFAVVGTPHVIVYVDDVEDLEVAHWGSRFRHHEQFAPRGANVHFVQVLEPGRVATRSFEFGVEDETLACGTGSAAAAITTAAREGWRRKYDCLECPFSVHVRSGDMLRVCFVRHDDGRITDVCLQTVVRFVYTARLTPQQVEAALPASPVESSCGSAS